MFVQRKTINTSVSISGIGLHSGLYTTVELRPVPAGSGVTFVRADLDGLRSFAAGPDSTGVTYHFATEANRQLFLKDPAKFVGYQGEPAAPSSVTSSATDSRSASCHASTPPDG